MYVLVYAWCDNLVTLTMNRKVIIIIITYEINLHLAACAGRVILLCVRLRLARRSYRCLAAGSRQRSGAPQLQLPEIATP